MGGRVGWGEVSYFPMRYREIEIFFVRGSIFFAREYFFWGAPMGGGKTGKTGRGREHVEGEEKRRKAQSAQEWKLEDKDFTRVCTKFSGNFIQPQTHPLKPENPCQVHNHTSPFFSPSDRLSSSSSCALLNTNSHMTVHGA